MAYKSINKSFIYFSFLLKLMFLCFSCDRVVETENNIENIVFSGYKDAIVDTSFLTNKKVVFLKKTKNSIISKIGRIYKDDRFLFILDKVSSDLMVFSDNGLFISKIGNKGKGPGEYIHSIDFTIDALNKQIIILCDKPYKILYYNYKGEFIKETKLQSMYLNIAYKVNKLYLLNPSLGLGYERGYKIDVMNNNGDLKSIPLNSDISISNTMFTFGNQITQAKNVWLGRRFDSTIYELANDTINRRFTISFPKQPRPKDIIAKGRREGDFNQYVSDNKLIYTITDVCTSPNTLIFNTNVGAFIYNFKRGDLFATNFITDSDVGYGDSNFIQIGNSNNIAFVKYPYFLKPLEKRMQQLKDDGREVNEKLLGLVKSINFDDNPFLVIYDLK